MKKLYFALFTGLVSLITTSAMAETATLKVYLSAKDAAACKATIYDGKTYESTEVALHEGVNEFKGEIGTNSYGFDFCSTLYLSTIDGYYIEACDAKSEGSDALRPFSGFYDPTPSLAIEISKANDGITLYPKIVCQADMRTAQATLTIDDASRVTLTCGAYQPQIASGTQTISFDPQNEFYWTIRPAKQGVVVKSVKLNGKEQEGLNGSYTIDVNNGDKVEVTTAIDTSTRNVEVVFVNPGTEAMLTGINIYDPFTYGYTEVADYQHGFKVAPNTQIVLYLNTADYELFSIKANGQALYGSYQVFVTITDNTVIEILAAEIPKVEEPEKIRNDRLVVYVDDPSLVSRYLFSLEGDDRSRIIENNIEAGYSMFAIDPETENIYHLAFASEEKLLDRVYLNGRRQYRVYDGSYVYYLELANNDVLKVYLAEEPEEFTVNFDVKALNGATVNAIVDKIVRVDTSKELTCLTNTQLLIENTTGDMKVTCNGVELTADYVNGDTGTLWFEIVVTDDANIVISSLSGIESLEAEAIEGPIYNLQGIEVKSGAITPGLYVVNGKITYLK